MLDEHQWSSSRIRHHRSTHRSRTRALHIGERRSHAAQAFFERYSEKLAAGEAIASGCFVWSGQFDYLSDSRQADGRLDPASSARTASADRYEYSGITARRTGESQN